MYEPDGETLNFANYTDVYWYRVTKYGENHKEREYNYSVRNFEKYLNEHPNSYHMMYGRELSYFTVFHKEVEAEAEFNGLFDAIKACLASVGSVHSFDFDGEAAIEIWVKPDIADDVTCLYLFPYDDGVVTYNA